MKKLKAAQEMANLRAKKLSPNRRSEIASNAGKKKHENAKKRLTEQEIKI